MVLTPLSGVLVKFFGWKTAFIVLGVATFVLCTAVSQLLLGKTHPEEYGMLPDGVTKPPGHQGMPPEEPEPSDNYTTLQLLSDTRFWIIAVSFGFAVMAQMTVFVHQVAYAEGNGIDRVAAASSLGIIGVASIAGRFFFGWLSDRVSDVKHSACLGIFCMSVAMTILLFFHSIEFFYLYACLFGFGYGSLSPMLAILMVDRFGRHISGTSYGLICLFVVGIGGSVGPLFGGLVYDITGSYTYAWQINLVGLMIVTVLIEFLKPAREASAVPK